MKTNKNKWWMLLIFALCLNTLHAQNEKQTVNRYALNAIEQAVKEYGGYGKYMVVTLKLDNISPTSGRFMVSQISSDYEYIDYFQPTHYIRINDVLVLVKADRSCNCEPEVYGISRVTENIKEEALMHLASSIGKMVIYYNSIQNRMDTVIQKVAITGNPSPEMIFVYKKLKTNSWFYHFNDQRPLQGREYWSDWKLSLGAAQKSAKPYWVKKINSAYDLKKIEREMKDSLQKILKENICLPLEVRNQDLNKLIFKPVFMYRLDLGSEVFSDTSSVYPYIKPDRDYKQPYRVLIFKENHCWGRLSFDEDGMKFETAAEIWSPYGKKAIDLYENVFRQKPDIIFDISSFGYGDIWYTKSEKIFLFFNGFKYHEEADEFIHRYNTPEMIMKR